MATISLTVVAQDLLRRRVAGEWVEVSRPAHSFASG